MITLPVIGQSGWGPVLNQALTDLDDATTTAQTDITRLQGQVFNVQQYGAVGDNVTNDRAAVQSAITAASAAGGGVVYFPPGTYALTPSSGVCLTVPSNVNLVGAGRRATQLRKNGAGIVIDISGPSTDPNGTTHVKYSGIHSMTLNGNSQTGLILRCYYANNHVFRDVLFTSNADVMVDGVEFWDSRFLNCQFESVGGAADSTTPAVYLRNASSATPATFGYSTDNTNQIVFDACRWENFNNGALRIEQGSITTNNPNGIYITNCKMETSALRGGSHLYVQDACRGVWVNGLYCFAGDFFSGYSTAQNIINWSPQASALHNVLISNGSVATVASGLLLFSGAGSVADIKNVTGQYVTNPTGAHVFFSASSTADFNVQNCWSTAGTQFGGTVPSTHAGTTPVRLVGGQPADASFAHTPLNGTLATNTLTDDLYVRVGGQWRAVARAGSNPADQSFLGWGYDSEQASSTNILTSGTVYLHKLWLPGGSTVNNLGWTITTAGSSLTAGQSLMGLYSAAGARLAVTADQSGNWTSTGFKSPALTAPLSITTSGYYYVAILSVGTTPPTGASSPGLQTTYNANVTGANLRHAVGATGQTALPSSITMSSNTSTSVSTWAVAF